MAGCSSQEPAVEPYPISTASTLLDSPLDTKSSFAESPLESPLEISPLPTASRKVLEPIQIDKPIVASATEVTGHGPAGVPIQLHDVTFGGILLASGVIDHNGRFELKVEPLEARHRIGIALGILAGTEWTAADFGEDSFGDEARTIPQVGFFYDTCMIREE